MNRITTERLDELIAHYSEYYQRARRPDTTEAYLAQLSALRELKSYRKAVREYLEAVDALKEYNNSQYAKSFDDGVSRIHAHQAAEAALRALAQEGKT